MNIAQSIGSAVYSYLAALRHLDREETSVGEVAGALNLPEALVEEAFTEFKMGRAKLSPNKKKAKTGPLTRVIELNPKRKK